MSKLGLKIKDKALMQLPGKYLRAGIMDSDGQYFESRIGVPQGSLCKALHKLPYAKLTIMQSNHRKPFVYGIFGQFSLHNIVKLV